MVLHEVVLGRNLGNGDKVVLGGKEAAKHKLAVGITGAGKSKFFAGMFLQLLNQGTGCLLVDPAGDLCDDILSQLLDGGFYTDDRSYTRLLYLDFSRLDAFVPMGILNQPYPPHQRAASVLEGFKRFWSSLAGGSAPVLEGLVLYGSLVLAINGEPLTRLSRLLTDAQYRAKLLANVQDEMAVEFFDRFAATGHRSNMLSESTLRRVSLLTFQPALRYALGQHENILQMRRLMDRNVSVLVNLGGLDPEVQSLLGCLITTSIEEAALSRADLPEERRTPYHCIIDEFSQFSARSSVGLERVLSLTRKYGLSLMMGVQVFGMIPVELRAALGQTTFIGFRLSRQDAVWGAELVTTVNRERVKYTASGHPTFMSSSEQRAEWEDILCTLPTQQAVLRTSERTIRLQTLGIPDAQCSRAALQQIKDQYAQRYLTPRAQLEQTSQQRAVPGSAPSPAKPVRRIIPLNKKTP